MPLNFHGSADLSFGIHNIEGGITAEDFSVLETIATEVERNEAVVQQPEK